MTAQDRPLRGMHLHVDCASGAAGDMMLGALIDLGVPVSVVGDALDAIGAGRGRLQVARVMAHGIAATDVKVDTRGELAAGRPHRHGPPAEARAHGHAHRLAGEPLHRDHGADVATHGGHEAAGDSQSHGHAGGHGEIGGSQSHAHRVGGEPLHRDHGADVATHGGHEAAGDSQSHGHGHAGDHHSHGHAGDHHSHGRAGDHHSHGHAGDSHGHAGDHHGHGHAGDHHSHGHAGDHHSHGHAGDHHGHRAAGGSHSDGGHSHSHAPGAHDHDHGPAGHHPAHGDHAHYHYAAIRAAIAAAELTPGTRRRALDIFDRIARAEARLHGTTVDNVAFHEVGAIDSVVDVVGTAAALDWLDPVAVTCTSVAMGHGTLRCAHGVLPVPAPAALEILREAGGVMSDGGVARELCTPTGAAILAAAVTRWSAAPSGRPLAIGWGAGDAALADRPNALRATVIEPVASASALPGTADQVWQIDANLDDMSPELCGPASDAVFAAGAVDVWWTPITMKKGRPALMISALASAEARGAVAAAILRETTTIGVRYALRERSVLARVIREVTTPYGAIPVKVARDGDALWNAAPEFEACAAAARRHGVPVKRVFAAALAAFEVER